MPRTVPTPISPAYAGTVAVATAPDAVGDIVPAGDVLLVVECGATGTTVSIPTTALVDGVLDVADGGSAVASGATKVFGPFPARLFAQPADAVTGAGQVLVDYTSVATVTRYLISR